MYSRPGSDWTPQCLTKVGSPWTRVTVVEETGSTNADLAAAARGGAPSGTVLMAGHQTSGRGRLDRSWTAPPGTSVAISVLLRPPVAVPPERWALLSLVAGLAVREAIAALGAPAEIKWPNDVLIEGKKVCGILAERVLGSGDPGVVIGMGINTDLSAAQLPVPTATSLALAGVRVPDQELLAGVLVALGGWYRRWLDGVDLAAVLGEVCSTIGRSVRVQLGEAGNFLGTAVGVDSDGRLLVEGAEGVRAFAAGDVVHLR